MLYFSLALINNLIHCRPLFVGMSVPNPPPPPTPVRTTQGVVSKPSCAFANNTFAACWPASSCL